MISALVDGELSGSEALEVRAHLDECPTCAQVLESEVRLKQRLSRMALPELPVDFEQRLSVAVLGPERRINPIWYGAATLAAAACFGAILFARGRGLDPETTVIQRESSQPEESRVMGRAIDPFSSSAPVMLVSNDR